jgi:hypothetical protein
MSSDHSLTKLRDNPELQKRLLKYSTAASLALAAGLALPARPGHADPGITCVDVDPDETVIGDTFPIDFDDKGKTDPEFLLLQGTFGAASVVRLYAQNGTGDAGLSVRGYGKVAYALNTSAAISSGGNWGSAVGLLLGWGAIGPWPGQTDKYLGLKFTLDGGNTHYGWALLDVAAGSTSFTIKEYCYNTTPDEGIHVGDRGGPPPEPVGGYAVPVNRLELLAPWLGAAAAALASLTAWWRRVGKRLGRRQT